MLIIFLIQVIRISFFSVYEKIYLFDLECTGIFNLCTDIDKERLGREAVRAIHEQMDDDKDGMIEASESRDVKIIFFVFAYFLQINLI